MPKCIGCPAQIEWVRMHTGSPMPVETTYVAVVVGGDKTKRQAVIVTDGGTTYRGEIVEASDPREKILGRESHYANCPDGARFRRSR